MKSGIYSITNVINKKIYIGSAVNILQRWGNHRYCFKIQKHHNSHLQSSWNQYGEQNFKFAIVELCEVSCLKEREKYYITQFKCKNPQFGYNVNDPDNGFLGVKHTEKTKQILSQQKIGSNNPMFGRGIKGENQPGSKLKNSDILYIRENYKKEKNIVLAKQFNISNGLVTLIGQRKRWTHI